SSPCPAWGVCSSTLSVVAISPCSKVRRWYLSSFSLHRIPSLTLHTGWPIRGYVGDEHNGAGSAGSSTSASEQRQAGDYGQSDSPKPKVPTEASVSHDWPCNRAVRHAHRFGRTILLPL